MAPIVRLFGIFNPDPHDSLHPILFSYLYTFKKYLLWDKFPNYQKLFAAHTESSSTFADRLWNEMVCEYREAELCFLLTAVTSITILSKNISEIYSNNIGSWFCFLHF